MISRLLFLLAAAGFVFLVAWVRRLCIRSANGVVGALRCIHSIHAEVLSLHLAHDDHVDHTERVLLDAEATAARAAEEARLVSRQLVDIAATLSKQTELLVRLQAASLGDGPPCPPDPGEDHS